LRLHAQQRVRRPRPASPPYQVDKVGGHRNRPRRQRPKFHRDQRLRTTNRTCKAPGLGEVFRLRRDWPERMVGQCGIELCTVRVALSTVQSIQWRLDTVADRSGSLFVMTLRSIGATRTRLSPPGLQSRWSSKMVAETNAISVRFCIAHHASLAPTARNYWPTFRWLAASKKRVKTYI